MSTLTFSIVLIICGLVLFAVALLTPEDEALFTIETIYEIEKVRIKIK